MLSVASTHTEPKSSAIIAATGEKYGLGMRFFNTEGPVVPADHYCVPPLERLDLPAVLTLIRQKRYFVLHAPRQTGKTSVLAALRDLLNNGNEGDYHCVLVSAEVGQAAREDVSSAVAATIGMMAARARLLGDDIPTRLANEVADRDPHQALAELLTRWSMASAKPLVLLVDEIDALVGDSLLSVLRQLRTGYEQRPHGFPWTIVLCGVRDIQDYRIRSSAGETITGGSPFNVIAKSLRLGDFTSREVESLLAQHSDQTGQSFTDEAVAILWDQTRGQPWLVNALCAQACFDDPTGTDRSRAVTADAVWAAREELILGRRTHLDQLAHKLAEPRVRRVVEPLLTGVAEVIGGTEVGNLERDRDLDYARDLGLIAQGDDIRMANPIYAEVVPRELGHATQVVMPQQRAWFVDASGDLDVEKLLAAFQAFFRENSEHWLGRFDYREAGPQLILQAYLQRIVNGGGRIHREYGLGRGATDLLILWPKDPNEPSDLWRRVVIECKVAYKAQRRRISGIIEEGIAQTVRYMERCGSETGHLVVFDRRDDREWSEKVFRREETHGGHKVVVWGI